MATAFRNDPATVAAVLLPRERARVEAAMGGAVSVVHRDSIPEAIRVVRERPLRAVLVSVHRCTRESLSDVDRLVQGFPGVPTVALVSEHDTGATETLLHFGARGIRDVVDVTDPGGWQRLRALVAGPVPVAGARIQAPILELLTDAPPDARLFFEVLIRIAPTITTVRKLCTALQVRPSTLMSRFGRAGLPSPKSYLAAMRLLHASLMLEESGLSVADVAYRLDYSSPQSFGRHLRALMGVSGTEFRRRFPFPVALRRYVNLMILPYRTVLCAFHPLSSGAWDSGH
ncbi:MAG: helix-turn-helix transcriptional regulator [Gemmatimonadales bacterium]